MLNTGVEINGPQYYVDIHEVTLANYCSVGGYPSECRSLRAYHQNTTPNKCSESCYAKIDIFVMLFCIKIAIL